MKRSNILCALGGASLVILGGLGATQFDMLVVTSGLIVQNATPESSDVGSILIGGGMISFQDKEGKILYFFNVREGQLMLSTLDGTVQKWSK